MFDIVTTYESADTLSSPRHHYFLLSAGLKQVSCCLIYASASKDGKLLKERGASKRPVSFLFYVV